MTTNQPTISVNRYKTLFITPSCWPTTLELLGEVQNCQLLNLQLHLIYPMTRASSASMTALSRASKSRGTCAKKKKKKKKKHKVSLVRSGGWLQARGIPAGRVARVPLLFYATPMKGFGGGGGGSAGEEYVRRYFPPLIITRAVISSPSMIAAHNHQHHKQQETRGAICVKQLK